MNENQRVMVLRKHLGLTLEKFGENLGVTKVAISNIEKGNRSLTEQMAKAICKEYRVSYIWLTTGDGEMFEEGNLALYDKIDEIMEGEDEFHKQLIKSIIDLDEETISKIKKVIVDLYESQIKKD